jgi:glycerate-2-kinase
MAAAAVEALGARLVEGVLTVPSGTAAELGPGWQVFDASHPLPNESSEAAGRAALALARNVRGDDETLLVCLSGGASAMLAVPGGDLTLADKRAANALMLRAGLDIGSMNIVRRHLSAVKGGQLAVAASQSITLAISDVTSPVDDDPLTIGSGPTVGDPTTYEDALAVIDRADIARALPPAVMSHLHAGCEGKRTGPIRPDDARLKRAAYWIVASRHDAMGAAADTARHLGYATTVHARAVTGEARRAPAAIFEAASELGRPACHIFSGETTVRVVGEGRGGRNQEVAVAALEQINDVAPAALASIGTDGIDGPTDAAGGLVDSDMWARLGSDARTLCAQFLDNNDAYPLLEQLGGLIKTGPTGTNVCDLQVLLLGDA